AAVNKEYGDHIKAARQFMETALDAAAAGGMQKATMEYAKVFYGGMFQAVEDGRALLVAFDFRPEGMNLHLQFQVGQDTKTNKLLDGQKPVGLDALGTLPTGLTVYTASHVTGDMLKTVAPLLYGVMGGEGDVKKQVEAAVE